ncbi:sensor histidine kinase RegB [Pseudogemmobacter humi]|uniref:histidine kinase n=1 Tax=Pseudogemmobacter humi TaxID=2483812 RepID=A0A3P5WQ96_9RHOB|nr:ActS/PrrB/RegB family redox-sensitive histidine kinase [Pseudogemmobacter humi]VDC23212.1 Sensor histidine kinase RegB [Pseudogemmobacter humi]
MRQIAGYGLVAGTGGDRVWLRTLILLRWLAIAGQLAAITAADRWFGLGLPLGLCYLAVGASIIVNLAATFVFPGNRRLSEPEALASLMFDLGQLGFLVFVTGGLTNPFALLILAPVTISASILGLGPTLILGAAAVIIVSLSAFVAVPIRLPDGSALETPRLFTFGFWLAIVVGLLFLGVYARRVAKEARALADALLATQMALAREQKLTDLGGVVAAAAHELGTPLATIKLVSSELMSELEDQPGLYDDARLIREQADRCAGILRGMGRAGKDDLQLRQAPVSALLREAAEPHMNRGKEVIFELIPGPGADEREPIVQRRPEVIHGLRNLVQNAVDFASSKVWVECEWTPSALALRIIDDGEGYPPNVINRIGDPFVRVRKGDRPSRRPEYEGMGLGLFIAKTLLERTGAELTFANASDPFLAPAERPERGGALVEAVWDNDDILAPPGATAAPNEPILP